MSRIEDRGPLTEEPPTGALLRKPPLQRQRQPQLDQPPPTAPVLLERMPPLERAVFVLREAFDCDFAEMAFATGRSEADCRRLAATASMPHPDGTVPVWPGRIVGAEQVSRTLAAVVPALVGVGVTLEAEQVQGSPGAVFRDRNRKILGALSFDILDGRIQTVRWVTQGLPKSPVGSER